MVLTLGTLVLFAFFLREGRLASRTYHDLVETQLDLEDAAQQIKTLHGIIPICGHCHKVRDDAGLWEDVAVYVRSRTEAEFSHSICPECMEIHYSKSTQQAGNAGSEP